VRVAKNSRKYIYWFIEKNIGKATDEEAWEGHTVSMLLQAHHSVGTSLCLVS
jgi:hypothetical protein